MEFKENRDCTQEGIEGLQNILVDFGDNIQKEKIDNIINKYKEVIGKSVLDKGGWINDLYISLNEKGQSDGWWTLNKFKDFCQEQFDLKVDHAAVGDKPWSRLDLSTKRLRIDEIEEIIKTATEKKGRGEETNELELVFLSLNKRGLISSIEERARKKEKYFEQQGGCIDRTLYVVQPCILHKGNPLQSAIL